MTSRSSTTTSGAGAKSRRLDPIHPGTALRLGRYFGTSPDLWLGLQAEYDLRIAERTLRPTIDRDVRPRAARG
jgi:plasmid maintenance system antidote protein VapI